IRPVIQAAGTYDLPFGRGRWLSIDNRVLDSVIGGWTVGSIFVFHTGQPIQLTGGFQTVNSNNPGGGGANNPAAGGVILATGVTLDMIQAMFNAPRTRLVGRAGTTALLRLGVDLRLSVHDSHAKHDFLASIGTPGLL